MELLINNWEKKNPQNISFWNFFFNFRKRWKKKTSLSDFETTLLLHCETGDGYFQTPSGINTRFPLRSNISPHAEIKSGINLLGSILIEKYGKLSFWNYLKIKIKEPKLQWNPDFSNPHFFKPTVSLSQVEHCSITPDVSNYPMFRTNFRFPWRFELLFRILSFLLRFQKRFPRVLTWNWDKLTST